MIAKSLCAGGPFRDDKRGYSGLDRRRATDTPPVKADHRFVVAR